MRPLAFALLVLVSGSGAASAQGTIDLGLPPASGSQNPVLPPPSGSQSPVLPPPSGSQSPVLPPPSGQRYAPGIGGRFGEGSQRQTPQRDMRGGSGELGVTSSVSPETSAAGPGDVDTLADLGPALRRCWNPPPLDGPDSGAMATVRFSLRRDGSLFGQPRVSWGAKRIDPGLQARFTQSIISAVRDCTPLRLSPRLGAGIAGRPFSIRFNGRAPSTERPT